MTKVFTGASMSLDGYISGPAETGFEHATASAIRRADFFRRPPTVTCRSPAAVVRESAAQRESRA